MTYEDFARKSAEEKGQLIASELGEDLGQLELQDALADLDELAINQAEDDEEEEADDDEAEEDEDDGGEDCYMPAEDLITIRPKAQEGDAR